MTRPTTPTPTETSKPASDKKRATPVPSDETVALRALREARKLDTLIATAKATLDERTKARADLLASMSPGARKIFDVQMGVVPGKAE